MQTPYSSPVFLFLNFIYLFIKYNKIVQNVFIYIIGTMHWTIIRIFIFKMQRYCNEWYPSVLFRFKISIFFSFLFYRLFYHFYFYCFWGELNSFFASIVIYWQFIIYCEKSWAIYCTYLCMQLWRRLWWNLYQHIYFFILKLFFCVILFLELYN